MTNPPDSTPRPRAAKPTDETIKETFESIVIAFILAFVFRAYVVEAFVIPTGSMAPTLLGDHVRVTCKQCGYTFTLTIPKDRRGVENSAVCPMCNFDNKLPADTSEISGDRILVEKFIYDFTNPRRWDVIVFKYPGPPSKTDQTNHGPRTNYIKRLVGLPNEKLYIFDGNIYVKPKGAKHWHIARKTTRPAVQNAVWQPIYDSQYIPRDQGLGRRDPQFAWSTPWIADHPGDWKIANRRNYRYDSAQPGRVHFSFRRSGDDNGLMLYPYNELRPSKNEPIEDIKLAAAFTPDREGLSVKLTTTARLTNLKQNRQPISARIDAQGHVSITTIDPTTHKLTTLAKATGLYPFHAGTTTHVQFWFVDQQASVWINGERVAVWGFNLTLNELKHRVKPAMRPDVSISVSGSPVTLHRVVLARDLYYTSFGGDVGRGRGTLVRTDSGVATGTPVTLGPNEFFCLGDNSPLSEDGRFWSHVDPWIQKRDFHGRFRPGIVPRRLIVGKAFFVYLPAPFPLIKNHVGILPNFGDMRFIH